MSMRPDDHRRKWMKEEYEKLAQERLKKEKAEKEEEKWPPVKLEPLKAREHKVVLDSKLGKCSFINKLTPPSRSGGFYCNICDCTVKDSITYLDHINGKKHQRNSGMSMKTETSPLDAVKKRFEMHKKKLEENKKEYDMAARMKEIAEEKEKLKEYRRGKKKRKAEEMSDEEDVKDELLIKMGFSSFGSSKKKY